MSFDMDDTQRRMQGAVSALETEFQGLRTGRASTGMLEPITVEAYGSRMPINQVGNISVPEPRLLTVQVWDASMTPAVEKAIRESDLGLNPQAEGTLIRIPVPDLSSERREELAKVAGKYAEAARVSVRNVRRDAIEQVRKGEKDGEYGEDERHGLEAKVQKLTDDHVSKVDQMLATKEKDIKTV
ncbi:MAG: ribosome recycling factor [Alphaproteobacteria bacterium]|jgi:ribosome recycling factor|nr:ribosome recycling factor [Alphaproteobacteria bacterium]MDG2467263.1 ribosome recycling factor [Alphaproteobacteria bacterium]